MNFDPTHTYDGTYEYLEEQEKHSSMIILAGMAVALAGVSLLIFFNNKRRKRHV